MRNMGDLEHLSDEMAHVCHGFSVKSHGPLLITIN